MARTVLHGSGRQQHHNVDTAVLQPSGDPDGLRRHAIPVKSFLRLRSSATIPRRRVFHFFCTISLASSLIWRDKDFFLSALFSLLVVAYSMIPTFAREHRTCFFLGGKG